MSQSIPNARLALVTGPAVEPLTLIDAKSYLKVDLTDDDTFIADMIQAAREHLEPAVSRTFAYTTWSLTLDYFPGGASGFLGSLPGYSPLSDRNYFLDLSTNSIQFPRPPLVQVNSLTYKDTSNTTQSLDFSPTAGLVVIEPGTPGLMTAAYGKIFPCTLPVPGAVQIQFQCGYSADNSRVPASVRQATRLLTAHYYYHRTDNVSIPDYVYRILDPLVWTV